MNGMENVLYRLRKSLMVVIDIALVDLSIFLAFAIRFDWQFTHSIMTPCLYFMMWTTFFRISLFALFGMYQWSFRYASISEAVNVLKSVTIGSLPLIVTAFFTR